MPDWARKCRIRARKCRIRARKCPEKKHGNPENVAKQIIPLTLEECEVMGEVIRAKN